MRTILKKSMNEKIQIEMIYIDNQSQISQRIVRVLKMNEAYFAAYCFKRKQTRVFKFDNVLSVFIYKNQRRGA